MLISKTKNKTKFHCIFALLLLAAFAFLLVACGGSVTEESTNASVTQSDSIAESEPAPRNMATPVPTSDPRVTFFNEMLLIAKQANDFYIHGDMTAWQETLSKIDEVGQEWDEMNLDFDTLDYQMFDYESEEAFKADHGNVLLLFAYIYYTDNNNEDAFDLFNTSIENEVTQLSAAYSGRGHIYRLQGDTDLALNDFDKAIELDPENADAYRGKAMISYFDQDDVTAANQFLKQALEVNPQFGRIYILQGDMAYYDLGDTVSAEAFYTQGLRYEPGYADGYHSRAVMYDAIGRDAECIDDMNNAINLKSNDGWYYYQRGYCHLGLAQYAIALGDFDTAISLGESDPSLVGYAYGGKASAYSNLEKYNEAIDAYAIAIKQHPENVNFYEWRADVYRYAKNFSAAIDDYAYALSLDPSSKWSYFGLGLAHDNLDHYQDAYANYEVYLEMEPGDMPETRYACDRMNALHLYNAQNLFDMFLGAGCNRFPSDSDGSFASGGSNSANSCPYGVISGVCVQTLADCPHGDMEGRCMSWTEYDQSAHTP